MKNKNWICPFMMMGMVLMSFVTLKTNAQNYQIRFAASGAATNVSSVEVKNLTKNTSVTLSGGDTLHLGSVGINEMFISDDNLSIYPNPMQGQSELAFYVNQTGNARLAIYDITGKEVMQVSDKLAKGNHKYRITGLKDGMYFISIMGESFSYTGKLISRNTSENEVKIDYLGVVNDEFAISKLKSTDATVNMLYSTGDRLLFKGISGAYSTIITDVPTAGKTITFNFVSCTDGDNNNYPVVKIGNQTWMAENLKTTKYSNGNSIDWVSVDSLWNKLATGAYCEYENSTTYGAAYGKLYNFYTVNDSRNACPIGWHVPTDADYTALSSYLGGDNSVGGKLKEAGIAHWDSPNFGASNETGFGALPGGYRFGSGSFSNEGKYGYWWTTTAFDSTDAYCRFLYFQIANFTRNYIFKSNGYSVRCLKN